MRSDTGSSSVRVRPVASDADLEAYVAVANEAVPDDIHWDVEQQRDRRKRDPRRLYLLAETDGEPVAVGFAGPSDNSERGFVAPRVLLAARRRGIGTALLVRLADHLEQLGFNAAGAHVDGNDEGSLAFARRFGFEETDRQVEQVRTLGSESRAEPPPGVTFVTIAERPELLREAYPLGVAGWADMATAEPVTISLDDWLADEATFPEGSFVALADGEIVGYSGLCRMGDDPSLAEDGLTVVRSDWRRRGLATALKRAELAWAAANGIEEIVTWTQRGNDGMRAANEQLGYVYRSVTVNMRGPIPLPRR
ncbi:MAG TPA: GNAT family N-acetyltransferase [Gaiellaceae bacterium]|nr:GNAT family N-acetyltransferase [Gaiellaceae bacterium]